MADVYFVINDIVCVKSCYLFEKDIQQILNRSVIIILNLAC